MKVYAEYFKDEVGSKYRRKTLLQFGDSNKLIGSVVLINPGSASPSGDVTNNIIGQFFQHNHKNESYLDDSPFIWKEFIPDLTMWQLEKIFNGWYLNQLTGYPLIPLNGVIQLFNCFYYKEQNLSTAEKCYDKSTYFFNEKEYFKDKPVYFGWGDSGKYGVVRELALKIFSEYPYLTKWGYFESFDENCFYHPGYINRSYKANHKTQHLLKTFLDSVRVNK